jgi:hypothetical protein
VALAKMLVAMTDMAAAAVVAATTAVVAGVPVRISEMIVG